VQIITRFSDCSFSFAFCFAIGSGALKLLPVKRFVICILSLILMHSAYESRQARGQFMAGQEHTLPRED